MTNEDKPTKEFCTGEFTTRKLETVTVLGNGLFKLIAIILLIAMLLGFISGEYQ